MSTFEKIMITLLTLNLIISTATVILRIKNLKDK